MNPQELIGKEFVIRDVPIVYTIKDYLIDTFIVTATGIKDTIPLSFALFKIALTKGEISIIDYVVVKPEEKEEPDQKNYFSFDDL